MAQFDVHRNPGRTKAAIPYVLVVQSDRWEDRPDRVVVPLVLASEVRYRDLALNPEFVIDGTPVLMNPLQTATIPTRVLGPAVGTLDDKHGQVIAALDALIAQGR
jgi:toxin CcdB